MATSYKVIVAVKPESTVTTQPSVLLFATSNAGVRQKAVALRKQHFAAYDPNNFFLKLQDNAQLDFTPAGKSLVEQRNIFQTKLQAGNAALLGETAEKLQINTVVLVNTMLADILVTELTKTAVQFVWATAEDKQQSDAMLPCLSSLKPQPPRTESSQSTTKAPLKTCKPAFPLPAAWQGLSRADLCPLLAGPDGRFGARVVDGKPATGNQRVVISGSEAQMGCAYESDKMRWFEINAQFVNATNEVVKEVYAYVAAVDAGHAKEIVTRWVKENDSNVALSVQADQLNGLYLFDWHVACKDVTITKDDLTLKYLADRRAEVEANSFYHTQAYKNELNGNSNNVDNNCVTALEQKVAALTAANEALSQQVTALETVNTALQQKLAQQNAVINSLVERITALENAATPQQAAFEAAMASGPAIQPNPADEVKSPLIERAVEMSGISAEETDKNMSDPNKVLTLEHGFVDKTEEVSLGMADLVSKYCPIRPQEVSQALTGSQRDMAVAAATATYEHKREIAISCFTELLADAMEGDRLLHDLLQGFNPHRFEDVDETPDGKIIAFKGHNRGRLGYYTLSKTGGKLTATFLCA